MGGNPKNNIHCTAISRNMLERKYSHVCSIWVDLIRSIKSTLRVQDDTTIYILNQCFLCTLSHQAADTDVYDFTKSVRLERIVLFQCKSKWRGNFRSLIKYQCIIFGIDHPPDHTTVGVCFFGLLGLCILGDPGAVSRVARKGPFKYFRRTFSTDPTDCNWVFEDEVIDWETHCFS